MATTDQQQSILVEPYVQQQLEVEWRIEDIMSAARRRAVYAPSASSRKPTVLAS